MGKGHRIGVIDDDPAVRDSIHLLLEAHGYQVMEYRSATDYLKNPGGECVLLIDLSLSDFNGMELVELLRNSDIDTPIILLTDVAEPGLPQRISATELCARLNKPVMPRELLACIRASIAAAECLPQNM